ncbi:MAG: hypothetical protein CL429_04760 [Acidimicrobiaceae bacterium]|nr:hypothetical protein [Acidimicrobiaceae bacterium]
MSEQNQEVQTEEAGLLTKRDFMVACQALAETHNRYLEAFQAEEEIDNYSRDEMEHAIQNTHVTFMKFQAILEASEPQQPTVDDLTGDIAEEETQDIPEVK